MKDKIDVSDDCKMEKSPEVIAVLVGLIRRTPESKS
jgi:hypothetical protein